MPREDRETFNPDASPQEETAKIKRARRARFDLDPEDGPLNYIRLRYGVELDGLFDAAEFLRERGLKAPDVKADAGLVWTSMVWLALSGNVKAGQYVLDRALGVPDKPYADRAQEMSREEVEAEIRGIFTALGTSPGDVDATVARLTARGEM